MLYEVNLFYTYQGQQCINTLNYVRTGTPAVVTGSFGLISALGGIPETLTPTQFVTGSLMRAIQLLVSTAVSFNAMEVKAVYDVTDFYELPYVPALAGSDGGTAASPVLAYGLRSNRTRTDIRRGMKRFVGVTEGAMEAGGTLNGPAAAAVGVVATELGAVVEYTDEGNALTFSPVIVSKQPYTPSGSTRQSYRYYPTLSEQMEHVMESILWQPYPQVRTQTSRQYGRGQ